jgi:isopenicillin-N N-acyltransferase-like protein
MKKLIFIIFIYLTSSQSAFSCTLWSARGDDWVKGGGTLIAKNRDWIADHRQVLKLVAPKHGYRYFGIHVKGNDEPGLKAGINEKGLVVVSSTAGSISKKLRKESDTTKGLLVRLLNESDSVDSALKKERIFVGPKNIMLADKTKIAVIEIGLNGEYSVAVKQNGVLTQTNHYLDEKLLKFNEKTGESSRRRQQRIEELLRNHAKPYSMGDFIAFSQDRNDGPDNSIRRTGSTPKKEVTMAVWIVYLPENGHPRLYVKLANPKEEEKTSRLNFEDVFK